MPKILEMRMLDCHNMTRRFSHKVIVSRSLVIGLSTILLFACGGCELIPIATLSAVFGIAGTAVSAGPEVFSAGKLDTSVMASEDDCRQAVRLAAGDLRLRLARDQKASGSSRVWDFQLQDDRATKIEVTVDPRSANLCRCRVNVGLFGSEPTARLIMQRIEAHLPASAPATMPS
jgi:hypothetical protein